MPTTHRILSAAAAAALALGIASAPPASASPCAVPSGVGSVTVGLLPAISDAEDRRERLFLSDALAADLGIAPFDPDGRLTFTPGADVNPQLRVTIESPAIDGRLSSAVFTVAGTFADPSYRIRIYRSLNASDKNSGEFKLFADAAPQDVDLTQTYGNGDVYGVEARVQWTPVSKSTVEENGASTPTLFYCEPAANGGNGFSERALIAADKRVVAIAPHGDDIEVKTSEQLPPVAEALDADWGVAANLWEAQGSWGLNQTFQRWHATSSAISPESFPALGELLSRTPFQEGEDEGDPDLPFRYALAFHGYGSSQKGVIVGGDADRQAKCLVVRRIQDELADWRADAQEIGFYVHDVEGDLAIPSSSNHTPTSSSAYGGQDDDNIVNRLSPNPLGEPGWGGIQLEQSTAVRTDTTDGQGGSGSAVRDHWLRFVVARGAAWALGELATGAIPTGACAQYE